MVPRAAVAAQDADLFPRDRFGLLDGAGQRPFLRLVGASVGVEALVARIVRHVGRSMEIVSPYTGHLRVARDKPPGRCVGDYDAGGHLLEDRLQPLALPLVGLGRLSGLLGQRLHLPPLQGFGRDLRYDHEHVERRRALLLQRHDLPPPVGDAAREPDELVLGQVHGLPTLGDAAQDGDGARLLGRRARRRRCRGR